MIHDCRVPPYSWIENPIRVKAFLPLISEKLSLQTTGFVFVSECVCVCLCMCGYAIEKAALGPYLAHVGYLVHVS